MRYARPLKKVFLDSTKIILSQAVRQRLETPINVQHSEHPFFLMHGFTGFSSRKLFNINLFDYFNGAKPAMEQTGYPIYSHEVPATESTKTRAEIWARHFRKALNHSGARKLHIIAHGQGAIDARILACQKSAGCTSAQGEQFQGMGLADKIASITSLGGPHLGTPITDHIETKSSRKILNDLLDYIAIVNTCNPIKVQHCLENLSRDYMVKEFNPSMQLPNTIPCYTLAAHPTGRQKKGGVFDRTWHQINAIAEYDGGGHNDGIIPVKSALFDGNDTLLAGTQQKQWLDLGEVTTDHLGMIGIPDEKPNNFSHLQLFIGLAQNVDSSYKNHTHMTLQANGSWQRNSLIMTLTGSRDSAMKRKSKVSA